MKKGLTHIVFIVDRSSSMSSIAKSMISGYNNFIKTQREIPGECYVSFYQFDDVYETVFEHIRLPYVQDLTDKTYTPRNMTALYDAMGKTINNYGAYLASVDESERPDRVLVVTITDGMDNSSSDFKPEQIRDMIKHQTEKYNWDFVFLGSNIDAWATGQSLGLTSTSTLQFSNVGCSVASAFSSLATNTINYRSVDKKCSYNFSAADYADQHEYLDDDKKAKNVAAINILQQTKNT